jgi:hypothetical protein
MVRGYFVCHLRGHLKNCWTTKYLYFGGKVLFGYKPFWFISKKLFETKTLVLVFKVDF